MAEGKEHALAIGYTKMSAQDMYVCSNYDHFFLKLLVVTPDMWTFTVVLLLNLGA